jgi:hypothetical protein
LETNARASLTFIVPHLRDKKGGPERLTDVRDIYENNANMGARRLRECIFAVLPKYLVQAAADECRNTLETRNAEVPLPKRIADMLAAFAKIGIDRSRIEAKLGATSKFTAVDLANLQISYKSIVRNEISAEDEFPRIDGAAPAGGRLDMLEDALDAPAEPEAAEVENDAVEQPPEEPDATADWRAKADEFLGGIRNAKRASYLDDVQERYREVCTQMPKELCDEIEAAIAARRGELGEGHGG